MLIQDHLTLKVLKLKNIPNITLSPGDKVVYEEKASKYIGIYIGYDCKYDYEVNFLYKLNDGQLEKFYSLDKKAKDIFYSIKDDLKLVFPNLKFVISKMNFNGSITYIYFYSNERVDFRPYLQEVKQLIGMNFFLYQVGARDSVRINPESKNICGDCGGGLCCTKNNCKLYKVESSTVTLQNLQIQGIDKQKGVCGKLKCCLKYEEKTYKKVLKNYPAVGTTIEKEGKIYTVVGINTLLKYMFLRDKKGIIIKENLQD